MASSSPETVPSRVAGDSAPGPAEDGLNPNTPEGEDDEMAADGEATEDGEAVAAVVTEVATAPALFLPPSAAVAPVASAPTSSAEDEAAVEDEAATEAPAAVPSAPPRRVIASFAAMRAGGATSPSEPLRATATDTSLMLAVPFRTQIDGTTYSLVNCGPASLAMVLAAFGLDVDPASVRDYLNYLVGNYDADQGTSLYILANIAREAGLTVFGSGRGSLQGWTIEEIRRHVAAGHPVITLTKYRKLPGHLGSQTDFDHYVVITGLAGEDFIYNDAAYATEYGRNLLISPAELEQAWADSSNPGHAVAIGLGEGIRPLPSFPRRLLQEDLTDSNGAEPAPSVTATRRPARPPAIERLRDRLLENLGARSAVVEPSRSPSSE